MTKHKTRLINGGFFWTFEDKEQKKIFFFWDRVSLWSVDCPETLCRPDWPQNDLPISALWLLELEMCAIVFTKGKNKTKQKQKTSIPFSQWNPEKQHSHFFLMCVCACARVRVHACGARALHLIGWYFALRNIPQPCLLVWESGFALYIAQTSLNLLFNPSLPWIYDFYASVSQHCIGLWSYLANNNFKMQRT